MNSDIKKSSEKKKSRPLLESDVLKPWMPPRPHHPLNKLHPSVLPQIYGEKNRPLRASPPVWQKKVNCCWSTNWKSSYLSGNYRHASNCSQGESKARPQGTGTRL